MVDRDRYLAFVLFDGMVRDVKTQSDLVNLLHDYSNPVTDLFAALLEPSGHHGWKLVLKRARRGRGEPGNASRVELAIDLYDETLEKYGGRGKRGAGKMAVSAVAQVFNMEPDAVRSMVRRYKGTHTKRPKTKGP